MRIYKCKICSTGWICYAYLLRTQRLLNIYIYDYDFIPFTKKLKRTGCIHGNINHSQFWWALSAICDDDTQDVTSDYWLKSDVLNGTFYSGLPWWRHQMETFSALLAICAGNSPVPGEFPAQRPVTRSFDVFFDLRLYKRLSKQSWGWWFETLTCPLWRHRNGSQILISKHDMKEYRVFSVLMNHR